MTCENCPHHIDTTGWRTQLANGCYCPIQNGFVYKNQRCDAIEMLMYEDMWKALKNKVE